MVEPHEFGDYYEVVAYYNPDEREQLHEALEAESCPYGTWAELEQAVASLPNQGGSI